ncbi:hypothetical protein OXPF_17650 [Oxobacter pfennigii]|uniref:Right handed beta helix domain-containing protein n=1 Tax=Oxobacter pfennigii TaxID=36849 RepID=A0A0P8WQ36_9CLOT|nr:right-handed parallel beta-helix repeat-containing protein [Oxobacter pfennigii]KPU44679.1 hypothetical protein OXPF_17650 [Oxobacter pfennigii]
MRNKAFNLLVAQYIMAVLVLAFGYYSYAWFSNSDIITNGDFTSGTLEIQGPGGEAKAELFNINITGPGWEETSEININNTGTLDFDYRMYIDLSNIEGNLLYDGNYPLILKLMRGETLMTEAPLNQLGFVDMGSVAAGESENLSFEFHLPLEADSQYQGASANLTFVFEARQRTPGATYPGAKVIYANYRGIQTAINSAADGDIIIVDKAGVYDESIVIDKPLTLLGIQKDVPGFGHGRVVGGSPINEVTITSKGGEPAITLIGRGTSDVTIKGFTIGKAGSKLPSIGIKAEGDISNVLIENNIFYGTSGEGIKFNDINRDNVIIRGNMFCDWSSQNITTISLIGGESNNLTVDRNLIRKTDGNSLPIGSRSIAVSGAINSSITNNIIERVNRTGIQLNNGGENIICSNNTITKSGTAAVHVVTGGTSSMKDITISSNEITDSNRYGILIEKSASLSGNTIENLKIKDNIIKVDTNPMEATTNAAGIWIELDPTVSANHGNININKNTIDFYKGKVISSNNMAGIMLMGKINRVDILNNNLTGNQKVNTGIYIKRSFSGYDIPVDAVINCPQDQNTIKGFNKHNILDERLN